MISAITLWLFARLGVSLRKELHQPDAEERHDFGVVLAATLTLLGLIIGFSFSMAVSRYDLRKQYEAEEANTIGTEYVRADLLPAAERAGVRQMRKDYVYLRIEFYERRNQA